MCNFTHFSSPILQKLIEFADFVLFELLSSAEPTAGPEQTEKRIVIIWKTQTTVTTTREFFANYSTREAYQRYLALAFAEEDEKAWEENLGFRAVGEGAEQLQAWEESNSQSWWRSLWTYEVGVKSP